MKKLLFGAATFLLLFGLALSQVNAQPVVVPNVLANTDANENTFLPFNCEIDRESMRYQQVYLGSEFGQAGMIDKISFRLAAFSQLGFEPTTFPGVQIELSTTDAQPIVPGGPNELSTTFEDNIGEDVTTVFMGDLVISARACDTVVCPFDIMIPLQEPFLYNPEDGNLLFDIRIPECVALNEEQNNAFDSLVDFPTISSRAISLSEFQGGGVSDPTGNTNENGMVTEFRFIQPLQTSPIPTLSEWGLISVAVILGIVGFMVIRRRKVAA